MKALFSLPAPNAPGGVGVYVQQILEELAREGWEVGLLSPSRPAHWGNSARWFIAPDGRIPLDAISDWQPDFYGSQGWPDWSMENRLIESTRSFLIAHDFKGLCISGHKSWWSPEPKPCTRPLGPLCLLHYFPHRCGGKNPLTLWHKYQVESRRLYHLHRFDGIVTLSRFLKETLISQGLPPQKIHHVPFVPKTPTRLLSQKPDQKPWVIGYAGRLEERKGLEAMIQALGQLQDLELEVHIVGTGDFAPRLPPLIQAHWKSKIPIQRTDWLPRNALLEKIQGWDVLVFPSLWPEPLGLTGMEAVQLGTPVAAFDVGGISEWLTPGVNGYFAKDLRPSSLAEAIRQCLTLKTLPETHSPQQNHAQGLVEAFGPQAERD